MDLLSLLEDILGRSHKQGQLEYYFNCPFCHGSKPKLAINVIKGAWHCWVCGASGKKLLSLLRKLDCSKEQIVELKKLLHEDIKYIKSDVVVATLSLPKEYHPLWVESNRIDYKHAKQYLHNRNISEEEILKYQIGYCPDGIYANRIIIPSHDEDGKLNYFISRSFYEDAVQKYKNPPISKNVVGFDFFINWNEPIILCEGIFDAIAIKRNAIPLLGKFPPIKLREKIIRNKVKTIYLALDNDALRETVRVARQFIDDGREIRIVELNEKDPSQLGFDKMNELIQQAKPLTFAQMIKMQVTV
jgi:DNA primase